MHQPRSCDVIVVPRVQRSTKGSSVFQDGEAARRALLDAAEQLYGTSGPDQVSSRRIAEMAGNTNHSAVSYHFGGRDGLIAALLQRHNDEVQAKSEQMILGLGDDATLADALRCIIVPTTATLDALPRPSWRARFLEQVRATPSTEHLIDHDADGWDGLGRVKTVAAQRLEHIPPLTLSARGQVLRTLVSTVCAKYEARIEQHSDTPDWFHVGLFLTDIAAGMLSADVTHSPFTFGSS